MREEEKKRMSQKSGMRRFLSKRWALPAIYLAAAAILLTAVLWFQTDKEDVAAPGDISKHEVKDTAKGTDQEAVEVNSKLEHFGTPMGDMSDSVVKKDFYDKKASKEEQEKAVLFYDNKYIMNKGIDLAKKDGKTFDVVAAVSGKVISVKEDSLLGNVIEIDSGKGITTSYQSVTDIAVKEGDSVTQGQAIAKAGQSLLNEEAGIHVHFEIRKDSVAVNPNDYFQKPVSSLMESKAVETKSDEDKENATLENEAPTEEGSSEEPSVDESSSDQENTKTDTQN
ncbi:M23 family metallopeptidase [Bacillus testis]|uniref:M23 family metallopeptidase n=1 Tax=Bacillus testis TaxID=1622072 RepID=UPI00067F2CCE|nr:M23 family metallopeptidase [Bacillus testis]